MTGVASFDLGGPLPTGRVAIEASAGTGKTFALAALAARLVAERGVPVGELLVVTFTRVAAAELRDRIRSRLALGADVCAGRAERAPDDAALAALCAADAETRGRRLAQALTDFDTATITTIHGFAQQTLAALGSASPGDLDATLVDDTPALVAQACADVVARAAVRDPEGAALLPESGALAALVETVLGNPGIAVVPDAEGATPRASCSRRLLDEAVDLVHERRRLAGTVSFDDVLTQLDEALRLSAAAREALRRRFAVVLVDEFQDTDPVQWSIFSRLSGEDGSGPTLVLVGDPKQAIYAFRGADVRTYLEASSSASTTRASLATNWRSSPSLVRALEELLSGATFGDDRIAFSPVRPSSSDDGVALIRPSGSPRPALHVRLAAGHEVARTTTGLVETASAEATIGRDLARYVDDVLGGTELPERDARRPVRPSDVAVLVATHHEARSLLESLRREGVPAVVARGASVLASRAAEQWRWLLSAIASPGDRALTRLAAVSWWFGWDAERVDAAADDALADVHDALARWGEVLAAHGPSELCAHVLADSGAVERVLPTPDGDRDVTDLAHVSSLLQSRELSRRRSAPGLVAALDELAASASTGPDDDVTARRVESEADAVQIMTVFSAKGLEFPVVCVPTLWKPTFAKARDPVFHDGAAGRRTVDAAPGEPWPDAASREARRGAADAEARGENLRLLYVALTRARFETAVWWAHAKESDVTGLARVLFARGRDGIDRDRFTARRVAVPADAALALATALGDRSGIAVTTIGDGHVEARAGRSPAPRASAAPLSVAPLGRELDRTRRRWSFTSVVDHAAPPTRDPTDETLGDGRADDEPEPAVGVGVGRTGRDGELGTDLPLGAVPGGARFGTLVHEVLERVDFAAHDLDDEITRAVEERLRHTPWPVGRDELVTGLRAAIETPLGPLLGGRSLRSFTRADRLDELRFELHLAGGGASAHGASGTRRAGASVTGSRPSTRSVGALVADHLERGGPVRAWAQELARRDPPVELAGHLTGSIDLVLRVRGQEGRAERFVVADYKTNMLGTRAAARSEDYDASGLARAMAAHDYPLQALFYAVALHRYLRGRVRDYDPGRSFGGAAYLFVRAMTGPFARGDGHEAPGVFSFPISPALVSDLSDHLDGSGPVPAGAS
ncbi:MAG: UvrD-helicase domain-containing protein [Actinomycetota bacterium]|nr:UvrD-helicase domain-containing protein [Actinomycetota bacterium]